MTLRYKFVLPINAILLGVLSGSLAWEWRRQEATGLGLVRSRLDEEARFVRAAFHTFGPSPRFEAFLRAFCHASDAVASPEHQVALVDADGTILASAAEHARRPMDPAGLAALGGGSWLRHQGAEPFLVRVLPDGGRRIVVAESARAVRDRVWAGLRRQALWFLGAAALLLGTTNAVIRYAVLHPLKRIGRAVRQLERGQLGIEVAAPGADELGTLARNFNAMSRALAAHAESTRRELMAAHEVQAQMLPPPCVTFGGLTVGSRSAPRGMVGGDVCDVQPLPGGRVGLLVADLAGHDVAAALHTAMLRAFAWQDAKEAVTPGELLGRLNERLLANLPEGRFATAFFAVYDPHRGVLSWANGGHPPALLWRDGDVPQELEPTGTILGIIPGLVFGECEAEMPVGSRLAVFSDGLTEARDPGGQLWGSDGIARVLAAPDLTPTERVGRILEEAARFRDGAAPEDDLTVIIAHVGDQAARREDCGDLTGVSPGRYDAATHLGGAEISPGGTVGR